jgi:hypothetical protein
MMATDLSEASFESAFDVAEIAEYAWGAIRLVSLGRDVPPREQGALCSAFRLVKRCEVVEDLLGSSTPVRLSAVPMDALAAHQHFMGALRSPFTGCVYKLHQRLAVDRALLHRLRLTLQRLVDPQSVPGTPAVEDLKDLEAALAMLHEDSVKRLTTTSYGRSYRDLHFKASS